MTHNKNSIFNIKVYSTKNSYKSYTASNVELVRLSFQTDVIILARSFYNVVIEFDNENFLVDNHVLVSSSSSVFPFYCVFYVGRDIKHVKYCDSIAECLLFFDSVRKPFATVRTKFVVSNCKKDFN